MRFRCASARDAGRLAAIHAKAFDKGWGADEIGALLAQPAMFAVVVEAGGSPAGFILGRAVADEAEIVTLAVSPARRRHGLGAELLAAAAAIAQDRGARRLFLEVASENRDALALYHKAGFAVVGERKAYYESGGADALVLSLDLNSHRPRPYHRPGEAR